MRITAIRTVVVNAQMRNWVFVKVETDEGLVGWGEATLEWKTRGVVGCVEDLAPFIIGQDPRAVEQIYQVLFRHPFFRAGAVGMSALSGIEQACWDILGKSVGLPVYRLLGGPVRHKVRMYDHLGGGEMKSLYLDDAPEQMAEKARQSVADGYTAVKVLAVPRSLPLEGHAHLRHAERVMAAIRDAVGPEVDIMVDLHGRTTPDAAIQYAQVMAPFRPLFLEEPCQPGDVDGLAKVGRAVPVPIAAGERLITRYEFKEVLEKHAVAVIQPDVCHCGGIGELRKIAAMAEAYYISVAPHNPLGPLATAASIHLALATPNHLIQECIRSDVPWRDDVVRGTLPFAGGYIQPPEAPGLGLEVDEKEAAKHPFAQEVLMNYFHADGSVADW